MISWETIQHSTQGRFGRTMAVCPLCSADRRTPQKRHSKVLAINLIEPEFAVYFCNHCGENGYCHPNAPRRVVDLAEQQRRRDEAKRHAETERQKRKDQALKLWDEGQPFRGSPAQSYLLHTRGIGDWLDTFPYLDQVFRFHPNCKFGLERHPCLIALVTDIKTDAPIAIHRTALTKHDPPQKIFRMSLGPTGGGCIKISPDREVHSGSGLMIAEGVETTLAASKLLQFKPIWSMIDATHLEKFPVLSGIDCVTIAVDNDDAGQQAAAKCTRRLLGAGIEVITVKTNKVNDFNDYLLGK
jgi:putative DNA primase/helicase